MKKLSIVLLLLLCWAPLLAQWSGNVDLQAGLGGMEGSVVNDNRAMLHGLINGTF